MANLYLDKNSKFNESTFDKYEFFYTVQGIVEEVTPADDFKGNVSCSNYYYSNELAVDGTFSWIMYEGKNKFKKLASEIEKKITDAFGLDSFDTVECVRYRDSEYAPGDDNYDVELSIRMYYTLDEE